MDPFAVSVAFEAPNGRVIDMSDGGLLMGAISLRSTRSVHAPQITSLRVRACDQRAASLLSAGVGGVVEVRGQVDAVLVNQHMMIEDIEETEGSPTITFVRTGAPSA